MALRIYKHKKTNELKKTLKIITSDEWEEQLSAPNQKFMETCNEATGKSKIKGLQKTLIARARNHSREVDAADQMTISQMNGLGVEGSKNLLNERGEKRRKIDDL